LFLSARIYKTIVTSLVYLPISAVSLTLLQEVITLTKELVDSQAQSTLTHSDSDDDDGDEEVSTGRVAAEASSTRGGDEAAARAWLASDVTWKSGDKCRAIWSENHQYVSRNCFIMSACLYCTST